MNEKTPKGAVLGPVFDLGPLWTTNQVQRGTRIRKQKIQSWLSHPLAPGAALSQIQVLPQQSR